MIAERLEREKDEGPRRGPQRLKDQGDQLEKDLHVKAVWLEVDTEDKDTETAHYFFLRGKPLAALQYLEKSLSSPRMQGMRLSLVAAFTNYATLMSKIGQHAHSKRLVVYAYRLLQHYVSDAGELIKGKTVNEKISLDGDGSDDPRFVSIRSSAAVVLHNVAVEQLLLAEIPNFGEAVGRAGEALLAAQHSLGPHHPWRQQVENTHHVIIQLCKKGKSIDMRRALKTQIKTLKHDTSSYRAAKAPETKASAAGSLLAGMGGGEPSPRGEDILASMQDDSDDSELGSGENAAAKRAARNSQAAASSGRIGSLTQPLAQPAAKKKREKKHPEGPPVSRSFESARVGTPDSDTGSEWSSGGGLSREERVKRELERIQMGRVAKASKEGVKGIEVRRKEKEGGVRPSGKQPKGQGRAAKIDSSALDETLAAAEESEESTGSAAGRRSKSSSRTDSSSMRVGTPDDTASNRSRKRSSKSAPRATRSKPGNSKKTPRAASSGRAQSKSRPGRPTAGEAWSESGSRPGSNVSTRRNPPVACDS